MLLYVTVHCVTLRYITLRYVTLRIVHCIAWPTHITVCNITFTGDDDLPRWTGWTRDWRSPFRRTSTTSERTRSSTSDRRWAIASRSRFRRRWYLPRRQRASTTGRIRSRHVIRCHVIRWRAPEAVSAAAACSRRRRPASKQHPGTLFCRRRRLKDFRLRRLRRPHARRCVMSPGLHDRTDRWRQPINFTERIASLHDGWGLCD